MKVPCTHCGSSSKLHPVDAKACARFGAVRAPQSIEYLARIEYEAQMKSADVPAMPWAELSETHREIARAGIHAVLAALEGDHAA